MASRRTTQFRNSLESGLTDLYAVIQYVASGNHYYLQQWNPGAAGAASSYSLAPTGGYGDIKSITRTGTGTLTVVFGSGSSMNPTSAYKRAIGVDVNTLNSTGSPTVIKAEIQGPGTDGSALTASGTTATVQLLSASTTASDPANGDFIVLHFVVQNTSAVLSA